MLGIAARMMLGAVGPVTVLGALAAGLAAPTAVAAARTGGSSVSVPAGSAVAAASARREQHICRCSYFDSDLFTADASAEQERALNTGPGPNYNASFSYDGRWIVFTSERFGSADVFRVHPDGSGLERLTDSAADDDQGALSPDGKTLAFVSTRDGGIANIWLLDLGTRESVNVTRSQSGNFRPSWSPDGQWLAFSSDREAHTARRTEPNESLTWELMQSTAVYLMRPDGSGVRRISPQNRFAGSPKWAQGGHILLYYRTTGDRATGGTSSGTGIFSMNLDSGKEHGLSDSQFRRFSPQSLPGGVVGYMEYQLDMHQRIIWAGLAYTSGDRSGPLTGSDPSWSPDGAEVVYHREAPNARSTLPGVSATTP